MTIVLADNVERRLRERAARLHGSRKGALSASIQEAVEVWLGKSTTPKVDNARVFRAYRGSRVVAEGKSLRELAEKMRGVGVDPRSVEIRSSEPLKKVVRIGVRLKHA